MRIDVVAHMLAKIKNILYWHEQNTSMLVISSSLFLAYDGSKMKAHGTVKWIDFAHVYPLKEGTHDTSFILGLQTLIKFLEAIVAKYSHNSAASSLIVAK